MFDRIQISWMVGSRTMDVPLLSQSDHQAQAGYRFGRLLKALGLTQAKAALELGVSKQRMNNWVKGVAYPDTYSLYKLCRTRGADFNYVLLGDWAALSARVAAQLERAALPKSEPELELVSQAHEKS